MRKLTGGLFLPGLAVALAISLFKFEAHAVPYASGVTNDGTGTIYFILNEAADNVTVTRNVGGPINLGALAKGTHSFTLGAAATYEIAVSKCTAPIWTLISDDTNNFNKYFSPGGIAVNRNPANLALFGRIYVAENVGGLTGSGRTVGDGIYIVNADQSDALGQGDTASTAGIAFIGGNVAEGQKSPFKIEVGEDNNLYIGDFSVGGGTIYRTDPDVTTSEIVLSGVGASANPTVHTTCNGSPIIKGSIAGGNLTVWAMDGQWGAVTLVTNEANRLLRWDIGAGPLPHNSAPSAELGLPAVATTVDVQCDLDIAPDGKFFICQNRAAGTPNVYDSGRVNVKVFATDGTTLLFDSLQTSLDRGSPTDILVNARAIKVSPDGKIMAVIRNDTRTMIVGLTNGIPDLSQTNLINTFGLISGSTALRREVAFDAAGNLYVGNNSSEVLRVWSPGGTSTTRTKSDGTFTIAVAPTTVAVAASDANADEAGPDNGTFTLTRTGDTSGTLTVPYTLSGTANNGADYATLSGSVTFATGASSTNITVATINDPTAEFTETATLTISCGDGYSIAAPGAATMSILDNETPELSITAIQPRMLECFSGSTATLRITRKGLLTTALSANVSYAPASGTDFNGPASVAVAASAVTADFTLTPVNDLSFEGDETVTVSVASGAGYTPGTPGSANATIIDDETVPGVSLFSDNFDVDSSAMWTVNAIDADNFSTFAYDYSADGIPPAPGTTGGTTLGLKFRSNESLGLANGLSASPNGQSFSGDYRLKFDMWLNYNGPLNGGGVGSTQEGTFGIGTDGVHPQVPGAATDGGFFGVAGDGGNGNVNGDYNAYTGALLAPDGSGSYNAGTAAGARENANAYYSVFGGVTAPALQVTLYPGPTAGANQTGTVPIGDVGFAWHCVAVTKIGETVNWSIDGVSIANITNDVATPFTTTGNIFLGYFDRYASLSDNLAVTFGLFDNVRVETVIIQPVITSIAIVGGNVEIEFTAGAGDGIGDFTLQSAGAVTGTYGDVGSTISSAAAGQFKSVRLLNGTAQFYRIRRL